MILFAELVGRYGTRFLRIEIDSSSLKFSPDVGEQMYRVVIVISVSDPHSLNSDPDPA
jgi:hypothetical protein